MYLILKSYSRKCIITCIKHRNVVPICNHNISTRFRKNVNVNIPRLYKSFGLKSSLNTTIILCENLKININPFKNFYHFKYSILKLL